MPPSVLDVYDEAKHRVQRYAVIPSLFPAAEVEGAIFDVKLVQQATAQLHQRWRRRLQELRQLGGGARLKYCRFCPASWARYRRYRRLCMRRRLCPFCWARSTALSTFQQLDRPEVYRLNAMELVEYEYLDAGVSSDQAVASAVDGLRRYQPALRETHGTYYLATVEPLSEDGGWRIQQRVLAILSPQLSQYELPGQFADQVTLRTRFTRKLDPQSLAAIIGRVCAYPSGLFSGPATQTLALLESQSGPQGQSPRLAARHGLLRRTQRWEQDG